MTDAVGSPDVDVVIATRDRPQLLRRAVAAVLAQDYAGALAVHVVFDRGSRPDPGIAQQAPGRSVHAHPNTRRAGLPGGRNTGVLAGSGQFVAFCDDDDEWLPGKLTAQVAALAREPAAQLCCTGIAVVRGEQVVPRVLPARQVSRRDLLRSRLTELHPSTFLLRREALLGPLGLVDEDVPHGYGEDYDLLLRAAALGPVLNVPEVLCHVHWHPQSYFAQRWPVMADGLRWLLERHPDFSSEPSGYARVAGQVAFALAADGQRAAGLRWAARTLAADPRQPRGYLAALVAARVLRADRVMARLNAAGRGI